MQEKCREKIDRRCVVVVKRQVVCLGASRKLTMSASATRKNITDPPKKNKQISTARIRHLTRTTATDNRDR